MNNKFLKKFSLTEWFIWGICVFAVIVSFFIFQNHQYHYLIGSLIGITALTFVSKGNPIGQLLLIIFSVFYGIISFSYKYYGEMVTYLGMSAPMALVALIAWVKNPYKENKSEVKINTISKIEWFIFLIIAVLISIAFYFILQAFSTSNLIVSTFSVFTSFVAAYLTMRRSKFYALAYSLNDIILIIMWIMASIESITYSPMVICFIAFLALDIYGFVNWLRMHKRQKS